MNSYLQKRKKRKSPVKLSLLFQLRRPAHFAIGSRETAAINFRQAIERTKQTDGPQPENRGRKKKL